MARKVELRVFKNEDGTYDGLCQCGYTTSSWPRQKIATERIKQHGQEHADGTPMEPLSQFRERLGLEVRKMKAVFPTNSTKVSQDEEESE